MDALFFEGFRLDGTGLFRVDREGRLEPMALGSRALDVLRVLADRHGQIASKDKIMDAVWPGSAVDESNLTVQISAIRRVLDNGSAARSLIENVPGRGYRLNAAVTQQAAIEAPTFPNKPSIAVLPFANLTDDPEQEYFADGMVEEIITLLTRIPWLLVIARSSTFTYKGQLVDVKQVGQEMDVRYVLDGSVRKNGTRVRIGVQLLDAETGVHLWADRFEGALHEIFELQDRVAISVAGVIEPTMEVLEMRRSRQRPTYELAAHDFYLRALPGCYSCDAALLLRAQELLERAIELDPDFGSALAMAAGCRQFLGVSGWAKDPEANRTNAIELARRALRADPNDPTVLSESARVLGYFTDELDSAVALVERALALNPSHARSWYWNGWVRLFAGTPEIALEHFRTAVRLNPRHRPYLTGIGVAHFFRQEFAKAIQALLASLEDLPGWPTTYRFLAAAYAQYGELQKARETFGRLKAITPAATAPLLSVDKPPFRNPDQLSLYREGLRLAARRHSG